MSYSKIRVTWHSDGEVLWVTLNAPPGNIIDTQMIDELQTLLVREGSSTKIKAMVFEGAGDEFSFGASIPEHQPGEVEKFLPRFHELFRRLFDYGRPLIAVVRGRCLGGGLELAALCNWVFAAQNGVFGLPEVTLGAFPPLASILLRARVGRSTAEALCITGRTLTADDAMAADLIDHVAADPAAAARDFIAEALLPKSAVALHFATRAVREPLRATFLSSLERLERMYLSELMATQDAREGIAAFIDKRKPLWKNC